MSPQTIKVIFDTNIYFALVAFKNAELIKFFAVLKKEKRVQIIYSNYIREELIKNLQEKKYKFNLKAIENLFKGMEEVTITLDKRRQPQQLRDKKDWHLFALAHFSNANCLVSGDKDILTFKPKWNKTQIMTLREFSHQVQQILSDL